MRLKATGAGNLFPQTAESVFLRVTGQQYDNMLRRVMRKGFPGLPFTKSSLRGFLLNRLGGHYDGFVRCPYCQAFCTIGDVAIDHALPLGRGGGVEIDNLDLPCAKCNDAKGMLTPEEFNKLRAFLRTLHPHAEQDVTTRLTIAVKLAAADNWRRKKARRVN